MKFDKIAKQIISEAEVGAIDATAGIQPNLEPLTSDEFREYTELEGNKYWADRIKVGDERALQYVHDLNKSRESGTLPKIKTELSPEDISRYEELRARRNANFVDTSIKRSRSEMAAKSREWNA
jgi:hypothetical protein